MIKQFIRPEKLVGRVLIYIFLSVSSAAYVDEQPSRALEMLFGFDYFSRSFFVFGNLSLVKSQCAFKKSSHTALLIVGF